MTHSNEHGTIERVVNKVMGVKTEDKNQSPAQQIVATQELDIRAILIYK